MVQNSIGRVPFKLSSILKTLQVHSVIYTLIKTIKSQRSSSLRLNEWCLQAWVRRLFSRLFQLEGGKLDTGLAEHEETFRDERSNECASTNHLLEPPTIHSERRALAHFTIREKEESSQLLNRTVGTQISIFSIMFYLRPRSFTNFTLAHRLLQVNQS